MSIIAKDNKKEFEPAPEGLHQAVCCDVVDQGMVTSQFGTAHKVRIYWQVDAFDQWQKPFIVCRQFTLSLHQKASLRAVLETWRGAKFRPEELENGFDLEKLVGANCQIQVIHNIKDDGSTYANVQAVIPPAKGTQKLRVYQDYVRHCDRDKQQGTGTSGTAEEDEIVPF